MRARLTQPKYIRITIGLLLLILLAGAVLAIRALNTASCERPSLPDTQACYRKQLKRIFNSEGLAAAKARVEQIAHHSDSLTRCHMYMHYLGSLQYEKEKDLGDVLTSADSIYTYCRAGFPHGVLEAYLQSGGDSLQSLVSRACVAVKPKGTFFNVECNHGLGHALMYITKNDLLKSLELCDTLASKEDAWYCRYGADMEVAYQYNELYEMPKNYFNESDVLYACKQLPEKYTLGCYRFAGIVDLNKSSKEKKLPMFELTKTEYAHALRLCESIPVGERYRIECIKEVTVYLLSTYNRNWEPVRELCGSLQTTERRATCNLYFAARARMLGKEMDKAYCRALPAPDNQICLKALPENTMTLIGYPH